MERSLRLLSISKCPSNKNATRCSHWLKQYVMAFPNGLFGRTNLFVYKAMLKKGPEWGCVLVAVYIVLRVDMF